MASYLPAGTDFSQLRQPIDLGTPGVLQIAKCLSSGSAEVRDLLLYECDILYECRMCRSMFRSLANFLAHKRIYCSKKFQEKNIEFIGEKTEESVLIVHPEDPDAEAQEGVKERRMSQSVLEKMLAGSFDGKSQAFNFYTEAVARSERKTSETSQMQLELTPIDGTTKAVRQQVSYLNRPDISARNLPPLTTETAKTQPLPQITIQTSPSKDTEDAEVLSSSASAASPSSHIRMRALQKYDYIDMKTLTCLSCKHQYSSYKSLYHHVRTQHTTSRIFYPCLFCKNAFTAIYGVTRHMERVHDKNKHTIDRLKDKIRSKKFYRKVKPMSKPAEGANNLSKVLDNVAKTTTEKCPEATANVMQEPLKNTSVAVQQNVKSSPTPLLAVKKIQSLPSSSCTVTASVPVVPCSQVVTIIPVVKEENVSSVVNGSKRPAEVEQVAEHAPAKKSKLSSVIDSLAKAKQIVYESENLISHDEDSAKTEDHGKLFAAKQNETTDKANTNAQKPTTPVAPTNETISIPKSARQKFLEETRKENQAKIEIAEARAEMIVYKCEICQKAFFKQDSYMRHTSYCVFDEDRIEAESMGSKAKDNTSNKGSKSRDLSPRSTSSVETSSKRSSSNTRKSSTEASRKSDVVIVVKPDAPVTKTLPTKSSKVAHDRKTRFKTGSLTPKVFDDVYESSTNGKTKKKEKENVDREVREDSADRMYRYCDLNDYEMKQINSIIDDKNLKCLRCMQVYKCISSLHRHAVRHFGWARFKCKLCSYTAFHRSECCSHLRRTHGSRLLTDKKDIISFIVELPDDQRYQDRVQKFSRVNKNAPTRNTSFGKEKSPKLSSQKNSSSKLTVKSQRSRNFMDVIKFAEKSRATVDLTKVKMEKVDGSSTSTATPAPKIRSRSSTHDGVTTLRGKSVVIKSFPADGKTQSGSPTGKVIVTQNSIGRTSRPAILRKTTPTKSISSSIIWNIGNNAAKPGVSTATVPTRMTSTRQRSHSAEIPTVSSSTTAVQRAKIVPKQDKHTDVFLLVVDEKGSPSKAQQNALISKATTPTTSTVGSAGQRVIVLQSTPGNRVAQVLPSGAVIAAGGSKAGGRSTTARPSTVGHATRAASNTPPTKAAVSPRAKPQH